MPTRTAVPAGAPSWIDISTSDVDATRAFYEGLFGWTSDEPDSELGGYVNFHHKGERVAGCMTAMPDTPTDVWTVYLASDDAERTCAAAVEAGGVVHAPAMQVNDLGSMAVVADPSGAPVGIWQAGTHPGLLTVGEPGFATWFELLTRDYDATVNFCSDVFGWAPEVVADTPEFRYTVGRVAGEEVAGVMSTGDQRPEGATGVPTEAPAQWSVYIAVADADATLARAVELGGAVVYSPHESPYGQLAALTDPTGALVKVIA